MYGKLPTCQSVHGRDSPGVLASNKRKALAPDGFLPQNIFSKVCKIEQTNDYCRATVWGKADVAQVRVTVNRLGIWRWSEGGDGEMKLGFPISRHALRRGGPITQSLDSARGLRPNLTNEANKLLRINRYK
jgi:hypothetical protein